ncbi:uncharacterized protein J3D65DRAFT_633186 [Phyllosticta citribraziliensis]|uniref:WHIM1 domain-containing protein n=1 Tax=Phyllosticta citribraziliensis TaxID=989973 RepID=A0ABR1LGM0_9PEZI
MSDSELSSVLSSPPPSDEEPQPAVGPLDKFLKKPNGKKRKKGAVADAQPPTSPPTQRKRAPSPPHEETMADNPDIAFIVMFRSRFNDVFPPKCPQLGPQDIERGISDPVPSPQVESLLCALLGLVLNRKKPVEKGHYGRAMEDAMSTYKSQWPRAWRGVNPLSGGRSFNAMTTPMRLSVMRAIILWSLHGSEAVSTMIKESYKQSRHDDDLNQPLSVQPWGVDGDKRRYWLIEGKDDTSFRLYRESKPGKVNTTWWNLAGTIEELRVVAKKLSEEPSQASRRLSERILAAIPRFEATEEKRKRREYRMARKAQFARPEPGFSLYEGRTRGKRMRYTFSEEEEDASDALSTRRSTRRGTPTDSRPTVTASGRQVRSRLGGLYGESLLSGAGERDTPGSADFDRSGTDEPNAFGRSTRSGRAAARNGNVPQRSNRKHIDGYNSIDEMDDDEDEVDDWEGGDEEDEYPQLNDDAEDSDGLSEDDFDDEVNDKNKGSLVVTLRIDKLRLAAASSPPPGPSSPARADDVQEKEKKTSPDGFEQAAQPVTKLPSPPASIKTKPETELNGTVEQMTTPMMEPKENGAPPHPVGNTSVPQHAPQMQHQAQDAAMTDAP